MGTNSSKDSASKPNSHFKCRNRDGRSSVFYNNKKIEKEKYVPRCIVPDDKVSWSTKFLEYKPCEYTCEYILKKKPNWADPENPYLVSNFNKTYIVDRKSFLGQYQLENGRPLNPVGRTGISGRGILGRWGPNHAADPIVTRWKTDKDGNYVIDKKSKRRILQFVAIKRNDNNEWAIPGGMCDVGEKVSQALKREFFEEAFDSTTKNKNSLAQIEKRFEKLFKQGTEIYRGYVDDPRNTDNAWMETVAYNYHDEKGSYFKDFILTAGDDAGAVKWIDIDIKLKLYANHKDFIQKVAKKHKAHW